MPVVCFRNLPVVAFFILAITVPAATSRAWCDSDCQLVDGHTRYMWSRTWNAQNSVTEPLTAYFIPRAPGSCRPGTYACSGGCANNGGSSGPNYHGAYAYPPAAAAGFDPVQFERLGQVPNEMSLGAALAPAAGGSAAATPAASQ